MYICIYMYTYIYIYIYIHMYTYAWTIKNSTGQTEATNHLTNFKIHKILEYLDDEDGR